MKLRVFTFMALGSMSLSIWADNQTPSSTVLSTDQEKLSYTIGFEMGDNLRNQKIDINSSILFQGIQNGYQGAPSQLSPKDMEDTLIRFQKTMLAQHQAELQTQADQNAKEGDTFLTENKAQKEVITLPDGLQYKVLKTGTGAVPSKQELVTVDYEGRFINGKIFDSSYQRGKPVTFGVTDVIPGWTEALTHMPVGSTWEIYIPPALAYGKQGMGLIGPNQTLIFKVHLISSNSENTKAALKTAPVS